MTIRLHRFGLLTLLGLTLSSTAIGQSHDGYVPGMSHGQDSMTLPSETGQSAFAALAEIVAILEADPNTNWATVSIDTLRTHLVDMDRLTIATVVDTRVLDGQHIEFQIRGEGGTVQAIQRMVPAHANTVRTSTDWSIEVDPEPDGATLRITPGSAEALTKLRALGFFGFMTIGAHHQAHHLQMATGAGH